MAEILEKCTLPSSHLRLTDCFLAPIRPTSPYFLRPNERKLVHCSIHPGTTSAPALDHSSLLLCLHKDLNSQLSIVSSSASADGATLILQNLSSTPFSLHPDVSLGQAMSWPIPLIAPYRLPSASPNLPWSLSSSRTGLGKTPKVQTPLQIQNLHYKTPSLLIGPDTKQGEETSLPGCHLSSGRIKEGFELWSVGMKVMEGTDGELNVVELHLGSLWRVWKPSLPLTLHIVPPGFEISSTPCLSCCSFHPWSSCPAMSSCSCPSPHTRLECSASSCWNCNDHHNWRQCPLPILTPQQLELTQLGFKFGERGITMEGTGERVKTLEEALVIMDKALAKNERNVMVGYEVLRILDILREAALKVGKEKVVERVEGVVDIQWLVPPDAKDRTLTGLCRSLNLPASGLANTEFGVGADAVNSVVEKIFEREVNMTRFENIRSCLDTFGLKLRPGDFRRSLMLRRTNFIPDRAPQKPAALQKTARPKSKTSKAKRLASFSQNNSTEFQQTEESDDGDDDDMLISYLKPQRKPEHPKKAKITELWKPQEDTNTFVIALKTLQIEEATYLASLSLRNLEGSELLQFPAIVPRGFYAEAPTEGEECQGCLPPGSTKPSLHRVSGCPAGLPCTLCPPADTWPSRHIRRDCRNPSCWNCGGLHSWILCPLPILTQVT